MNKGRTQKNGPKDKKIDEYVLDQISNTWLAQIIWVKKRRRKGLTSIEDWVDESMQGPEEHIKKSKKDYLQQPSLRGVRSSVEMSPVWL